MLDVIDPRRNQTKVGLKDVEVSWDECMVLSEEIRPRWD